MSPAKEEVELLLHKLPDSCSIEDIQYIAAGVHGKRPVELEIQPSVRAFPSTAANNGLPPTRDTLAVMFRHRLGRAGAAGC